MRFFDIYPLAKAAYRRANGGTYAPSVHEEVETKFNLQEGPGICGNIIEPKRIEEDESLGMPKLVVRNTFLDLEDSEMDRKEDSDRGAQRIRVIFNMDKQMRHCGIWFHTLLVSLSFGYWPCSLYDDSIWCIKFSNSPGKEEDTQDPADRPKRRTRSAKRFPVELSVAEFA
ncbi:Uncharacterized protein SCF082_LOCUS45676 [Durusdinium trenchii]|uniref:Uncharacterized protein n=1 Tax=Durusdinium trenchii TaxID=1381693 RepID=A0ABP0R9X2_9DINO